MRRLTTIAVFLLLLAAGAAGSEPTVSQLLSLKAEGMKEGDRLQNVAYCMAAGQKARESGQFGTALDLFTKSLELDPERTEAHLQKALLFGDDRVGLHALAVSELRLFLAANPGDGQALAHLGWEYRMNGRIDEAMEQFKAAAARDPGDWWIRERYGELLIAYTDRIQDGIDSEIAALSRGDPDPFPHTFLAQGYFILGKYAEARASATRAAAALSARGIRPDDMNRLLAAIEGK